MKIGIYDPYLDDLGGGEKYMMSIASCLSLQHTVSVFWNDKADFEKLKERFGLNLKDVSLIKNIFSSDVSFLQRIFATKQYDVIIVLSDGSIPFILSNRLYIHIQQPLARLQNLGVKDKLKIARVQEFFCNSYYTESFIDKKFQLKTSIIYPPVDFHYKKTKKENIILHVGRFRTKNIDIDDYKKQHAMIDIFKIMIQQGLKSWKFIIAASVQKKDEKAFEEMRKSTQGFPIEFAVNKNNAQLWEYYNRAKIYWHASGFGEDVSKHPEYAEHFGITTVEAMGAGVVPIVINLGGQKEIVTQAKNGFLWNTKEECIEKTKEVMRDEVLWNKLSKQAKQRAKDFSNEKFCERITQLIG